MDGAFSNSHGLGCGGILRDHTGSFIEGFMFKSIEGDSLAAESWALVLGLRMAWEKGARRVINLLLNQTPWKWLN